MPERDREREEGEESDHVETVTEAIRTGIGGAGVGGLTSGAGGIGGPADEPLGLDEDAAEIRRSARDDAGEESEEG